MQHAWHVLCRAKRQLLQQDRAQLPIWPARESLLRLVQENRSLVIVGETGSGKTTQIPQFLLHGGFAKAGAIACTQPRRVAACSVARRVAEEMGTVLGGKVSYSIAVANLSNHPCYMREVCHCSNESAQSFLSLTSSDIGIQQTAREGSEQLAGSVGTHNCALLRAHCR